jgi:hydrogenase maturation protease
VILIIAYGNSLRRDDGAGLVLGELLEEALRGRGLDVLRIAVHQLTPDLAFDVAAEDIAGVVFVDTRVAGAGEGQHELQICLLSSDQGSSGLGHHVGASSIMTCARLLYDKSPPAWLLTVPGVDFDHGEGLSELAQRALDSLPALLHKLPPYWLLNAE